MPRVHDKGYTLLEALVVVAIVGIVAAVAVPNLLSKDPATLDLVASEVAEALRYGRSEAIRTAEIRTVGVYQATEQVRVSKPTISGGNLTGMHSVLTHPVSKKSYDFFIKELPYASGIRVVNTSKPFYFKGLPDPIENVLFDGNGCPFWLKDGVSHQLASGEVRLAYGGEQRLVRLVPITGRVTIE